MSIIRVPAGDRCYLPSGPQLVNTIDPWIGVRSVDLTPDGLGTVPMRANFSNIAGKSFVPQNALSFRVWCNLMRGQAPASGGSIGGSDVSLSAQFWGYSGQPHMNFAGAYANGGGVSPLALYHAANPAVPIPENPASPPALFLYETSGNVVEFPNIIASDGSWGNFYWQLRGSTPLGAACMLNLISFDMPAGSAPLDPGYPVRNTATSSLMLYYEEDLLDHSPFAHSMSQVNSGLLPGGAFFDGTSSYQTIAGSPTSLDFAGDFSVEVKLATATRAPQAGTGVQRRILSFGQAGTPSVAMWIDPSGGGVVCGNEFTGPLKVGTIPVDLNRPMIAKWTRQGTGAGNNILTINGYQDGPAFTDNTHWTVSSANPPEIGRLNGNNLGHFSGLISSLQVVNGAAI